MVILLPVRRDALQARSGMQGAVAHHSANAQLLFVSGSFQLTMKGEPPQTLSQRAYAYIPARHQHRKSASTVARITSSGKGLADVHYADASGKEISPEIALVSGRRASRQGYAGTVVILSV